MDTNICVPNNYKIMSGNIIFSKIRCHIPQNDDILLLFRESDSNSKNCLS